MPNRKKVRRPDPDIASTPGAAGAASPLHALREAEARKDADAALGREADRAVRAASAVMDGRADDDEHRRISQRAYEIYLERGERDGDELTDWLEAERQIRGGSR